MPEEETGFLAGRHFRAVSLASATERRLGGSRTDARRHTADGLPSRATPREGTRSASRAADQEHRPFVPLARRLVFEQMYIGGYCRYTQAWPSRINFPIDVAPRPDRCALAASRNGLSPSERNAHLALENLVRSAAATFVPKGCPRSGVSISVRRQPLLLTRAREVTEEPRAGCHRLQSTPHEGIERQYTVSAGITAARLPHRPMQETGRTATAGIFTRRTLYRPLGCYLPDRARRL